MTASKLHTPYRTSLGSTTTTVQTAEFEVEVVVAAKVTMADDVVALTLRETHGRALPPWRPGAHIDLLVERGPVRQYSLCGDPADRAEWRIGVLREPGGGGGTSAFVHDELLPGARVRVRGPRNHFALEPADNYLFLAGGIGITPLLPMMRAAHAAGASWTLGYGGHRRSSMPFLDEVAEYGEQVVLRPHDEGERLDLEAMIAQVPPGTLVYCCGPEAFLTAVDEACANTPGPEVRMERFTAREVGAPVLAEAFEVVLQDSGHTLTVPPERSILSVVGDAGIRVLTSCEEGTCGTCETAVLEGVPEHRDSVLTTGEREANDCMMICVSRSCTPRLVLEL